MEMLGRSGIGWRRLLSHMLDVHAAESFAVSFQMSLEPCWVFRGTTNTFFSSLTFSCLKNCQWA